MDNLSNDIIPLNQLIEMADTLQKKNSDMVKLYNRVDVNLDYVKSICSNKELILEKTYELDNQLLDFTSLSLAFIITTISKRNVLINLMVGTILVPISKEKYIPDPDEFIIYISKNIKQYIRSLLLSIKDSIVDGDADERKKVLANFNIDTTVLNHSDLLRTTCARIMNSILNDIVYSVLTLGIMELASSMSDSNLSSVGSLN